MNDWSYIFRLGIGNLFRTTGSQAVSSQVTGWQKRMVGCNNITSFTEQREFVSQQVLG